MPTTNSYRPTSALAKSVWLADDRLHVALMDGRVVPAPLTWFPRLQNATAEQIASCEIGGGGVGLHWPEFDEDLTVAGLLAGAEPSILWSSRRDVHAIPPLRIGGGVIQENHRPGAQ